MFLPSEYTWFEPVLIAAIIVFIVDFIGSMLVFSRRPLLNALASAILFAVRPEDALTAARALFGKD
jgi:hypothetical protein